MEQAISLTIWKKFLENRWKKKLLIKIMWNEQEKITLFITPNLKINSFIYDDKEGYLFYDNQGQLIDREIPCILPESKLEDGKVKLAGQELTEDELGELQRL